MPRGVYDRSKMKKKFVLKPTAELNEVKKIVESTKQLKLAQNKKRLNAEQINKAAQSTEVKQVSAELHNRLILDYQTLKTEHKQLVDGNNFIRRVLADRVNTIILLLEQLRGSL